MHCAHKPMQQSTTG